MNNDRLDFTRIDAHRLLHDLPVHQLNSRLTLEASQLVRRYVNGAHTTSLPGILATTSTHVYPLSQPTLNRPCQCPEILRRQGHCQPLLRPAAHVVAVLG